MKNAIKYPITPDYLKRCPDEIVKLFEAFEEWTIRDIVRRLTETGQMTGTALQQMDSLQRLGYDRSEIDGKIRQLAKLSEQQLKDAWQKAYALSKDYRSGLFDMIGKMQPNPEFLDLQLASIALQTDRELMNITQSMGFMIRQGTNLVPTPVAGAYQKILDDAMIRILNGAQDYNAAIRESVKLLTDSGLQSIDYASGHHARIDVAVRRAVMTGISQMSAKASELTMQELETGLIEVTAHAGARDTDGPLGYENHKAWQGKVYTLTGTPTKEYPSAYEACGYGEIEGLCGINCRHHFYPFIEGVSERTYTDEELKNIDPAPFTFEGKRYTIYEATQRQRAIERAIRKTKRELIAADAQGNTQAYTDKAVRLKRLEDEYSRFSEAAGLVDQRDPRATVNTFSSEQYQRAGKEAERVYADAGNYYALETPDANVDEYLADLPIRNRIKTEYSRVINQDRQNGHFVGTNEYNMYQQKQRRLGLHGPSVITVSIDELQELFNKYSGSGILKKRRSGAWAESELITTNDKVIGYTVDLETGEKIETACFGIAYSKKKGWHIFPQYADLAGRKGPYDRL